MQLSFYKYQSTGNDFIVLNNLNNQYDGLSAEVIKRLCHRRFGIGADGLMLLNTHPDYDFEMKYYNADGREGSMCGNGGRSLTRFAADMGIIKSDYRFLAIDGPHESSIETDGTVALKMKDVDAIKAVHDYFILDTGSPHYVQVLDDVMHLDVAKRGADIRYSREFAREGNNVNFVEETVERDKILVRTYERGVEGETLSCGTGVTAAALVCSHNENGFNRVEVQTKGGHLSVEFDRINDSYENIWLIGPAEKVFEGTIAI
ncbi:MAG TPA: diaminopimelate epimerase [Chitinophagaceae bacterium]|nr:diaminopimelate epimerase [Chitinophagaceae bacterium]